MNMTGMNTNSQECIQAGPNGITSSTGKSIVTCSIMSTSPDCRALIEVCMSGMAFLILGFSLAAVLKVTQGSSTVAMIVGSGMVAAILGDASLGFNPVYVATAVGSGSLVGSWMNDSGFWIFAKMGGLTEAEALKTWTPLLMIMGIAGFLMSILLSQVLPLVS